MRANSGPKARYARHRLGKRRPEESGQCPPPRHYSRLSEGCCWVRMVARPENCWEGAERGRKNPLQCFPNHMHQRPALVPRLGGVRGSSFSLVAHLGRQKRR